MLYSSVGYGYDSLGRLNNRVLTPRLSADSSFQQSLTYSSNGSYSANTVQKLTTQLIDDQGAALATMPGMTYNYTYDKNGNITEILDGNGKSITYKYDALNRLTRENNQLRDETTVYTYDAGGNLLEEKVYPYTTGTPGTAINTNNYVYNNNNWKDQFTSYNGNAITYDNMGNPKTYDGKTFSWQRGSQLTSISGNGQAINYSYNAKGERVSKTVDGVTTVYTYAGGLLMRQDDGENILDFSYDANGQVIGFNHNGEPYFYLRNLQGDVVAITDAAGELVAGYEYDAWGNSTVTQQEVVQQSPWKILRSKINAAPANTPTTIAIAEDIAAPADEAGEAIVIPADRQITLVSSSTEIVRTLTQEQGHRHFIVNGSLTLGKSITLSGGMENNTNDSGGVEVKASGKLIMNAGSVIENCRRTIAGGGVTLAGTDTATGTRATFTLAGGTIRNNQATNGGGINIGTNSHMTITNGLIQNNITTDNGSYVDRGGGGIRAQTASSVLEMSGGTIENNVSARYGGGVLAAGDSVFTMTGSTIRGNSSTTAGGGVGVTSAGDQQTTFNMSGGSIEQNTSVNGGGVATERASTATAGSLVTMSGGTIKNNTATTNGGGLHITAGATFKMDGANAKIENNKSTSTTATNGGGGVNLLGSGTDITTRATFAFTKGTISGNEGASGAVSASRRMVA